MSTPDSNLRASARVALIALTASTASLDVTAFTRLGGVFASVMTSSGHPRGWTQLVLLGIVAATMGGQSAAARQLGNPNASTTYLTGTVTSLAGSVALRQRPDPEAVAVILALLAGAAAGVGLLEAAPISVPLLALAGVGTTAALSWRIGSRAGRPKPGTAREAEPGA